MLALIAVALVAMKAVVSVESQASGQPRLPAWNWFAFAALWPGMRPALLIRMGSPSLPGAVRLIRQGLVRLTAGLGAFFLAWSLWKQSPYGLSETSARVMATPLLLVGLSLMIHFGIFDILAGAWRWGGVDCRPLFRAPLRARSLTEFWGRRWNLAFTEMTALAVYRPLGPFLGKRGAMAAAFFFSGLLHEMAISLPVRAGYGLPLLYFALHGGLVLFERRLEERGRPIDRLGWPSRVWTLGWLAVPLPILFHPPFLNGVVWPLIGMEKG